MKKMNDIKKTVFILYEEREESQLCGIRGAWNDRQAALKSLEKCVLQNVLYTEDSIVDIDNGIAKSDPTYSEGAYSDYTIKEINMAQ